MDDELVVVKDFLKTSKHTCLYIRNKNPRQFKVLSHIWGNHFWSEPIDSLNVGVVTSFMYFCSKPDPLSFSHESYHTPL